jgi:hypothetical protein|tara:strand:- start:2589 stop:2990 length:402 start_codon:yes stop_codon:yes gene_type:complete
MILKITSKIMRDGIIRFAKENNVNNQELQLLIYTEDNSKASPKYKYCVKGSPIEEISFNNILNLKYDLMNREGIAKPFIQECLLKLSDEYDCKASDLLVFIYSKDMDCSEVGLYVYKDKQPKRKMDLKELFNT